ncbi:type VI secretion system-associated FHA domain protein [Inquilinus sp. CA228]|uniref:type VI secretion system-associated FHA domain protein n=1 Tax=Inquilinus sp. CA228 TaxID=3455609 RepID=UPI003F8D2565
MPEDRGLILRIVDPPPLPGLLHRKVFDSTGGTIGRGADCAWALPDPSREVATHHARILYVGGAYLIVSASPSGVRINEGDKPLPMGSTARLATGDRLRIGPFNLLVESDGTDSATAAPQPRLIGISPAAATGSGAAGPPDPTLPEDWEAELGALLDRRPSAPPLRSTADSARERLSASLPDPPARSAPPGLSANPDPRHDLEPPSGSPHSAKPVQTLRDEVLKADVARGPLSALLCGSTDADRPMSSPFVAPLSARRPAMPRPLSPDGYPVQSAGRAEVLRPEEIPAPASALQDEHEQPRAPSGVRIDLPDDLAPRMFAIGLIRGLGLQVPALSEERMAVLGYEIGRTFGALADMMVELGHDAAGVMPGNPYGAFPTGLLAVSELINNPQRSTGSIERETRNAAATIRRHSVARRRRDRATLEATLLRFDPVQFAKRFEIDLTRRDGPANAWKMYCAHFRDLVDAAMAAYLFHEPIETPSAGDESPPPPPSKENGSA